MRLAFALGVTCCLGAATVLAQGGMQNDSPTAIPASAANYGQEPQGPVMTLHARTNLVVVDVVVSDSKHNPIHGLTQADFLLLENKTPQKIKSFEEHVSTPGTDTSTLVPMKKLPPGLFSNAASAPVNGPVNVLLLDSLNTPMDSQPFVRQQLLEYLKKTPPGTRIAIFGLSTTLSMLQGFSSDPEVLKAALSGKGGSRPSDLLVDPQSGAIASDSTLEDALVATGGSSDPSYAQELANIKRFQALQTAFELQLRAKYTLDAFNLLARYLVGIPGRKNVIWFSGSFPLNVAANPSLQDPFDSVVSNDEELRQTDNLLTRSQIAVYPVDARGLFNMPGLNATSGKAASPDDLIQFAQDTGNEHMTMETMAEDTGGMAFLNTNGLSQAVAKAIENGSNYYTLSYSPSDLKWDGRFRAIKISMERKGVSLTYRRGYYADDPEDRHKQIAEYAATAPSHPSTMATAMMRGGPDPSEILFKLRVRPSATPSEDALAPGNRLNPDPKVKIEGPYRRYGLDYAADAHGVSCPETNGTHHCAIEVATYVYDHDGVLINTFSQTTTANLSAAGYTLMLKRGIPFHEDISVPLKGDYFLRTAIHDLVADRVGAIEVPVASVARLKPLQQAALPEPAKIPTSTMPDAAYKALENAIPQ